MTHLMNIIAHAISRYIQTKLSLQDLWRGKYNEVEEALTQVLSKIWPIIETFQSNGHWFCSRVPIWVRSGLIFARSWPPSTGPTTVHTGGRVPATLRSTPRTWRPGWERSTRWGLSTSSSRSFSHTANRTNSGQTTVLSLLITWTQFNTTHTQVASGAESVEWWCQLIIILSRFRTILESCCETIWKCPFSGGAQNSG